MDKRKEGTFNNLQGIGDDATLEGKRASEGGQAREGRQDEGGMTAHPIGEERLARAAPVDEQPSDFGVPKWDDAGEAGVKT